MPTDLDTGMLLAAFPFSDGFAFMETSSVDIAKADVGLAVGTYNYLSIFYGREGGFSGQVSVEDADATLVMSGMAYLKTLYTQWLDVLDLNISSSIPYYPAYAHGDLNGDGDDDIAYVGWFEDNSKIGTGVFFGPFDGLTEEPDMILLGEGYLQANYPESTMTVAIEDLNGDGKADLIVSATREIDVSVESAAISYPQGRILAFLGRTSWPSVLSTYSADIVITEDLARDEDGRLTPYSIVADDFDSDGYADLAVGSPRAVYDEDATTAQGKAYVFRGHEGFGAEESDKQLEAIDADVKISGDPDDTYFGILIWLPGDLQNSGYPNLMVGSLSDSGGVLYTYEITPDTGSTLGYDDAISIATLEI
jgi:hypothetical protein